MAVNRESCRRNRRAPSTIACDRSAPVRTGIALSIEFNRAARGLDHYSLPWEGLFSVIRGFAFGAGLYRILGFGFAIAFCHSYHNRPSIRLFSRHASCHRLCRVSSSAAYASSTVGFMATALVCSSILTSNTTLTTFRSDGLGCSASDSSYAVLLCSPYSIG